ncbi:MAG: iron ABC transporter permease [Bacteroidales bacterium]|nr:iron ABC transporter permease [Bacteroidales bacterium]MDT8430941.1 iron ABC transporter permease [Bacteroidales bacterium]
MTRLSKSKFLFQIILLAVLLVVLVGLDISLGTVKIPFRSIVGFLFSDSVLSRQQELILLDFRIPRVVTALLAGAALSVSGLQMQTIFRNPLAGPYILGISSGASLGAALVLLGTGAMATGIFARWGIVAAAWIGAASVMFILLLVTIRIRNIMTILILGIMFSSGLSAVISLMQYFGNAAALKSFVIWSMGSLGAVSGSALSVMLIAIVPGLLIALLSVKGLNAMMLGEEYAGSLGVSVRTTRVLVFASTSILAGTVTAFCGPIGFIGIAVPHITRFLTGRSDMRFLVPATLLVGMIVLVFSDIISQVPGSDRILPINAITSLIGIPVVVWVVISSKKLFN